MLINITGGPDVTLFEVDEAATRISAEVDSEAHIIVGSAFDPNLDGTMRVSVVATGIDANASQMPAPTMLNVTDSNQQPVVQQVRVLELDEPSVQTDVVIEAAAEGATTGMQLAINVAAMLIAFVALVAMIDLGVGWLGSWFGMCISKRNSCYL